jgi:hypothetical protein
MFQFFRKFRQKLLTEKKLTHSLNGFSKYFLYAIGEIVLVVIGILIALQINNWNEKKSNRELEQDFYANILDDLEKDEIQLNNLVDFYQNRIDQLGYLLDAIKNPVSDPDIKEFGKHVEPLYYNMEDVQYSSSFESARSSGAFSKFQNKNILKELTQFYAEYSTVQGILRSTLDIIKDQLEPIMATIPESYLGGDSGEKVVTQIDYANQQFYEFLDKIGDSRPIDIDLEGFLQKPEFENYIIGDLGRCFNGLKVMNSRLERVKDIQFKISNI